MQPLRQGIYAKVRMANLLQRKMQAAGMDPKEQINKQPAPGDRRGRVLLSCADLPQLLVLIAHNWQRVN